MSMFTIERLTRDEKYCDTDLYFEIQELKQTEYGNQVINISFTICSVNFFKTNNYIDEINDFIEKNYGKVIFFKVSYRSIKDHILYSSIIKEHFEGLEAYRKHKESSQQPEIKKITIKY